MLAAGVRAYAHTLTQRHVAGIEKESQSRHIGRAGHQEPSAGTVLWNVEWPYKPLNQTRHRVLSVHVAHTRFVLGAVSPPEHIACP